MVIDSHCHIFPETFSQNRVELSRRDATFAELFSGEETGEITRGAADGEARMATSETLIKAMDADAVEFGFNGPNSAARLVDRATGSEVDQSPADDFTYVVMPVIID